MKKIILVLCLLFAFSMSSCSEEEPIKKEDDKKVEDTLLTVTFNFNYNDYVIDIGVDSGETVCEITNYPDYEGYEFVGWSQSNLEDDLFDFNTPITKNITLYGIWKSKYKDYSYLLDEYIPDVLDSSLDLPTRLESDETIRLMWSSSDNNTLTTNGTLIKPRLETKLTVYLQVYDDGNLLDYEKEVTVKPFVLKELPTTGLVIGYYSTWNYFGLNETITQTCDILNLCFAYVTNKFTLDLSEVSFYLPQIVKARESGVRVLLSVQGYSSGGINFSNAASTEEGRTTLANSMLEACEKYHLDGIDIDWEYPGYNTGRSTAVDKANYTLLMKKIKETFNAKDPTYLLTAAIPGGPMATSRFDLAGSSKWLDYINIMTYDLNSGSSTHHTALYPSNKTASGCTIDESYKTYINAGVPASKLVIGLAFYGKYSGKTIPYTKLRDTLLRKVGNGVTYYFDEKACAPYLIDENGVFYTYDDEVSIKAKCEYALEKQIAGVMIWEVGEDESLTLLKTIKNTYKR